MSLLGKSISGTDTEEEIYQLALDGLESKVASGEITRDEFATMCLGKCDMDTMLTETKLFEFEQKHKHRLFHRMLGYFQKLVSPLNRQHSALDTMVQANPIACLVWGAMKTVLLTAHDLQENFEVIVDGLQEITDSLPNHHAYRTIIISEPQNPLRPPLIRIYVETLTYSILATRYLKNGVLKLTGKAILRSETYGFKKCMSEIKKQSTNVNSLAIGDIWQTSNATMEELREAVKVLKDFSLLQSSSWQLSRESTKQIVTTSNVPALLSTNFVAREGDLAWIRSTLESDAAAAAGSRRVAIYGMTGVGKSQLILKYEERYRATYVYRFWFTSGTIAKIRTGVGEILDLLDLPERIRSEPHVQDAAIRAWLESTDGWLLMFDNVAEEDYKAVLALLPQGVPKGDIIFTSQRPGAMDKLTGNLKTKCLRLEELNSEDAVDLFYLAANVDKTKDTEADAQEIVRSNGFLPQAISQAGSYIRNTEISFSEYMRQFRLNASKLLEYDNTWDERNAISSHMQISLDSLKENNRNALNLLKLFAFFEPESIPALRGWKRSRESSMLVPQQQPQARSGCLSMFSCFRSSVVESDIPMERPGGRASNFYASSQSVHLILKNDPSLDEAISNLRDFSLIKALPEGHRYWMHDLTRFFVRQSIVLEEVTSWLCLALEVLFHTFPDRDETILERSIVDVFLPQAESIIAQAKNSGVPLQKYAKLISICGVCFHDRASYNKALAMFETARPIYEKQLGPRHEKTLTLLHRIGWCHRELGDLILTEKFHSRTLAARKKVLPSDSLDLFISMTDLASVIERQGKLKEAEILFKDCFDSQRNALGSSDRRTLAAAHNLALCLANQGRLVEAENLCKTTLLLSKAHYGDDDPGTLRTASNLAVFVDHNGRVNEALAIYQESLTRYTRRYGYNHILTMRIRSNLAGIWRLEGNFAQAELTIREVLSELIRLIGPDHVHVCTANFDLAEILHEEGKVDEAQERYQVAITVFEFSDPEHPILFRMLDGIGILYREMGNIAKSDAQTFKAYDKNMALLGWLDPYTMMSAHNRAEMFMASNRLPQAQQLFEKCLAGFSTLLGPEHPHNFMTKNSLGCLELRQRHFDSAISHFHAAKAGFSKILGETHGCTLTVQMNIGRVELEQANFELAITTLNTAKDGLSLALGPNHPHIAVANFYLGLIAARQSNLQRSIDYYLESMRQYELTLGIMHPNYIRAVIELLKVVVQLPEAEMSNYEYGPWLSKVNKLVADFHAMGCMLSTPESMTLADFKAGGARTDDWSVCEGLPWGEQARLRWGRKTTWRDADEGILTA